jgi:translation initiation factor IF-1
VRHGQDQQKRAHDKGARPRDFSIGDLVYARNYGPGVRWLPGEIVSNIGSTMYEVKLTDGRRVRKHADQLRSRVRVAPDAGDVGEGTESDIDDFDARIPRSDNSDNSTPADPDNSDSANSAEPDATEESETPQGTETATPESETVEQSSNPPEPRRSARVRYRPDRYGH